MHHKIRLLLIVVLSTLFISTLVAQTDNEFDLPLTESVIYTVQEGDTLDRIGARFDMSVSCLQDVNQLTDADLITIGDELLIDITCPFYSGTLPVDFPREANTTQASEGEAVPAGEATPSQAQVDPTATPTETVRGSDETYFVVLGDTLDTIAQDLDVSVISLRQANGLEEDNLIFPGDELIIPASAPPYGQFPATDLADTTGGGIGGGVEGDLYIMQPGDTIDTVAQEFDVSVLVLLQANQIENSFRVLAGTTIVIPANAPAYGEFPIIEPFAGVASEEGGGIGGGIAGETYIARRGDTFDTIAQQFDVSVISLRQANGFEIGQPLPIGQTVIIPDGAPAYGQFPAADLADTTGGGIGGGVEGDLHVMQVGDSIDQLAANFNAATSCILEANEIANARAVLPGTTIVIPSGCPPYTGFAIPTGTPAPEDAAG